MDYNVLFPLPFLFFSFFFPSLFSFTFPVYFFTFVLFSFLSGLYHLFSLFLFILFPYALRQTCTIINSTTRCITILSNQLCFIYNLSMSEEKPFSRFLRVSDMIPKIFETVLATSVFAGQRIVKSLSLAHMSVKPGIRADILPKKQFLFSEKV